MYICASFTGVYRKIFFHGLATLVADTIGRDFLAPASPESGFDFFFSKKTLVQETPQSDVPFSLQCSESLRTNSCISLSARETHISIFLRPSKLIITFSPFSLIVKRHQLWSGCSTWVSIHCQHVSAQQSQAPSPGSHLGSLENSSQRTFYQVLKSMLEVVLMTWISI